MKGVLDLRGFGNLLNIVGSAAMSNSQAGPHILQHEALAI
jgi:hypothetical protein